LWHFFLAERNEEKTQICTTDDLHLIEGSLMIFLIKKSKIEIMSSKKTIKTCVKNTTITTKDVVR